MSNDVLVRGLSDETLAALDAAAQRAGLSRVEWIRRALEAQLQQRRVVTVADLRAFGVRASDLGDSELMADAWS